MPLVTLDDRRVEREIHRSEENAAADRQWRRRLWRLFVGWCAWYVVGAVVAAASFGVSGREQGDILLWLGLSIGNIGAWLTVTFFSIAATERGDL